MTDIQQYNPYPSFQPGQQEAVQQILELRESGQKVVELNAPTAAGKCVSPDTEILMLDGSLKTAKDIQVGDKLLGPDSKPRLVLSTTRGRGPMYRVVPTWGESFECNSDHILNLVSTFEERNRKGGHYHSGMYKLGTKVNIPLKEYLEKPINFKHHMKLWHSSSIEFPSQEVEWDPYIIGIWLGDGHKTEATVTNEDKEVISAFEKFAKDRGYTIRVSSNGSAAKTYHMTYQQNQSAKTVCNTKAHFATKSFRYYINKSCVVNDEKRIPNEYLVNDEKIRLQVLAGLIDTDGYLATTTYYEISTKYKGLAEDICFLAGSLGLEARLKEKIKTIKKLNFSGTYYSVSIHGNISKIPCRIPRKKCNSSGPRKRVPLSSAFEIQEIGEGDYNGFTLDGDGLFLLRDFTVTHNSLDLYVLGRILTEELATGRTVYTTPLVALVNQLENETAFSAMPVLKGKRNYPCDILRSALGNTWSSADDCPFENWQTAMGENTACGMCPYHRAYGKFMARDFGATTLARYQMPGKVRDETTVLLVDESAGLEKTLIDRATLVIPKDVDLEDLVPSLTLYYHRLSERGEDLDRQIARTEVLRARVELVKERNKVEREARKCAKVLSHLEHEHPYIIDKERKFRLLDGRPEFRNLIENLDLVILASGTPATSIITDDYKPVVIQHPIPVERRLCYYWPIGSMNFKERQATAPKMAQAIADLHARFGKKTMVHCGAYVIARMLHDAMQPKARKLCILQRQDDREGSKDEFLGAKQAIFLSVNFEEGLDLKGEAYPLNIIAKVPFENIGDEFIKARNERDNYKRYNMHAAVAVMQAAGRCTRSASDFSETYILDGSWQGFFNRSKRLFQPWFVAALKKVPPEGPGPVCIPGESRGKPAQRSLFEIEEEMVGNQIGNSVGNRSGLEAAILYLAGQCDGAVARDGAGFNARDTEFGHSLAGQIAQGRTLSPKQKAAATKVAKTYKKQLLAAGIEI